jgi:cysteine desulfurase
MKLYLDHNATTPLHPKVQESSSEWIKIWGNPSSIHWAGRESKNILRETRQTLATQLGCSPLELVFNSGGSEGNNTVIKSVWNKLSKTRPHFMCSAVEHPSVMRTFEHLETLGAKVDYIPVSREGILDLDFIKNKISDQTALLSVMLANNETGHIFPIKDVVEIAKTKGALVHSDCVQTLGKIKVDLRDLGVDYASFSAHKFYSLKGTGFLYLKKTAPYEPLVIGGGQERHRRGGTENVPGLASLGVVAPMLSEVEVRAPAMANLRNYFEKRLLSELQGVTITGPNTSRLPNTSSMIIEGIDGETLLMSLDLKGIAVSTGAACSSGNPEPSPVLLAMGMTRDEAQTSLRVSLGWSTTQSQIDEFTDILKADVIRLRDLKQQREVKAHG